MENKTFPMRVIKKPKRGSRTILYLPDGHPDSIMMTGHGCIDLVCGKCGAIIYKSASIFDNKTSFVFKCSKCNKYNEMYDIDMMVR